VELAERVVKSYPGLEQVRFVSSGTEATMSAIRLARAFTGRDLIVKFSGCYHGHADHLLVAAGSGLATFGTASSAGVPAGFVASTRVLPLDDEQALRELFAKEGSAIAAVIIEPVPANHGLLLQRSAFLHLLREETRRHGTLLIFDEVISGFRVARGGAAEHYRITPDMATFGKIVGGGMPVGRVRRLPGHHESPGAGRGYLPGRHAVRQSRRHGRRHRDPRCARAGKGLGSARSARGATRATAGAHRRHGAFSAAPGAA
jgi:glutamate-1-semialdehyde 2,1-aminomutase